MEAVRAVRVAYWQYAAEGDQDSLLNLFADDACLILGEHQGCGDKEVIQGVYEAAGAGGSGINPSWPRGYSHSIEINGNTAHAIWLADSPVVIDPDSDGYGMVMHINTKYIEDYVRENGVWKISSLEIIALFTEMTTLIPTPGM